MPIHSMPDLTVTALLQNLNDELDRKKMKKMEDLMLAKMQSSVHGRLGPRINDQHEISHWRGGGELCGAIFMCNRRTWKECLVQCLFGLPIGKKSLVEQVIPGMKLFLFEYERRQLWGVFEAISYGGMDIIPNAYTGGSFPCQVRVKVPEECVALYEEEFFEVIRDNYFSLDKFHFDLSEKQVCRLTSLFERKYFRANLLGYEDKRYISEEWKPNGGLPLLLANDAHCLYPEDLPQVTKGPLLFNSEEGRDHPHKNGERRIRRKSSEKGSLIPLPSGALDIVQSNVASLTGELGKGFDIVNASCLTFYDSNYHSIVEDFTTGDVIIFPDNVSRLHSDRPIAKSVWARISGRSNSLVALESTQVKKSPEVNPVMTSSPKVTILEMEVEDDSLVQDQVLRRANASEEVAEEFSVGFKRRRASNNNASEANVDETTSKRRRKLTRPSFEVAADEHLVEQGKFAVINTLPSVSGPLSKSSSMAGIVEDFTGNITRLAESTDKVCLSHDVSKFTASDPGEGIVRMSAPDCNQGNGALQSAHIVYQPNTLDLNLPVEASIQNDQVVAIVLDNLPVLKDERQSTTDATASRVSGETEAKNPTKLEQHCEMQQEPCCLALSLATQETVLLHSREGNEHSSLAGFAGHMQKQPQASEDTERDKPLVVDVPEIFIGQSKQGGRAGEEGIENRTGLLGKEVQGSDLQQPHISSESTSVDLVAADSLRASIFSLAPCTPAKDFLYGSYSVTEQCDDRKAISHDLVQDIPLTLELGNCAHLPDVKLHLHDTVHPKHASGNLCRREDGNNAVVHDESSTGNPSRESNAISLDCASGSKLLNQVDLKSFLGGVQVSGIRLQLGASPCLILQLGDSAVSTSNVDSQEQGETTRGQPESG